MSSSAASPAVRHAAVESEGRLPGEQVLGCSFTGAPHEQFGRLPAEIVREVDEPAVGSRPGSGSSRFDDRRRRRSQLRELDVAMDVSVFNSG